MNLHDFKEKVKAFRESDHDNDVVLLTFALDALKSGVDPLDIIYATSSAATNHYMIRQLCLHGRINEVPTYRLVNYPEYIVEFGQQCDADMVDRLRKQNFAPYWLELLNNYTQHVDAISDAPLRFEQWVYDVELALPTMTEDKADTFCAQLELYRDYLLTVSLDHVERFQNRWFYLSSHSESVISTHFRRGPALRILQTLIAMTPSAHTLIQRRRWSPEHIAVLGVDKVYAPGHSIKEWLGTGASGIDYLRRHPDIVGKLNVPKRDTLMFRGPGEFAFMLDFLKLLGPKKANRWLEKYSDNLWVTEIGLWLPREHVKPEFYRVYDDVQQYYRIQDSMKASLGSYYQPLIDYCLHNYQDYFLFDMRTETNRYLDVKTTARMSGRSTPIGATLPTYKAFWDAALTYLMHYQDSPALGAEDAEKEEISLLLN